MSALDFRCYGLLLITVCVAFVLWLFAQEDK